MIVNDARRHGVQVVNVDLNTSAADCMVVNTVQLGLSYMRGLGKLGAAHVVRCRSALPYASLADVCQRTHLSRTLIENLITAGALDTWGIAQRTLLWQLRNIVYVENGFLLEVVGDTVTLPALSEVEAHVWEVEMTGVSTLEHLLHYYRPWLQERGLVDSRTLATMRSGTTVAVAGQLVVHQAPPTAKGTHFITLEDEHGFVNLILHPGIYPAYRTVLRESVMIVAVGTVQRREGGVVNVVGTHILPLRLPVSP